MGREARANVVGSARVGALDSTTPLAAVVIEDRGAEGDGETPKPLEAAIPCLQRVSPAPVVV